MAFFHFDHVGIVALAGVVPEFIQRIDADPSHPRAAYIANFVKQTGIMQRHISLLEQTASDLGYVALNTALEKAGWSAQSLDGLIFLTQTPDFNPATGNSFVLHNHMKLREDALTLDIAQGCASFPFGLSVCASLLAQPGINRMAMVSGDTIWPMYPNREALLADPVFLPGEGATAMLLEKKDSPAIYLDLHSDGGAYNLLYDPSKGIRNAWRGCRGILPNGAEYCGGQYMDGLEITSFATIRVVESIKDFLARIGKNLEGYHGLVLHQANLQIVKTIGRRLKAQKGQLPVSLDRYANTNGASATLTMVDAYAGRVDRLNLLIAAFGIGLSWGIASLNLDASVIAPMLATNFRFEEDFIKRA